MGPAGELVDELEGQPVHVGHGKHGYHLLAGLFAEHAEREGEVRPEAAIGEHNPFRETGGSRRVVDDGQFFRLVTLVGDVFRAETVGEFLPE